MPGGTTWEAVYRSVIMAGRPQHLGQLSNAYNRLFQVLDEISRRLRTVPDQLASWQGGGADEYRKGVQDMVTNIDNFYSSTIRIVSLADQSSTSLATAMAHVPVPVFGAVAEDATSGGSGTGEHDQYNLQTKHAQTDAASLYQSYNENRSLFDDYGFLNHALRTNADAVGGPADVWSARTELTRAGYADPFNPEASADPSTAQSKPGGDNSILKSVSQIFQWYRHNQLTAQQELHNLGGNYQQQAYETPKGPAGGPTLGVHNETGGNSGANPTGGPAGDGPGLPSGGASDAGASSGLTSLPGIGHTTTAGNPELSGAYPGSNAASPGLHNAGSGLAGSGSMTGSGGGPTAVGGVGGVGSGGSNVPGTGSADLPGLPGSAYGGPNLAPTSTATPGTGRSTTPFGADEEGRYLDSAASGRVGAPGSALGAVPPSSAGGRGSQDERTTWLTEDDDIFGSADDDVPPAVITPEWISGKRYRS